MNMGDQWHLRALVLTMMLAMLSIAYGCGRTEFYELSGSISSVNYPSWYSDNIDCTYSIRSPGLHQTVLIGFTDFDIEATYDTVQIWCSTSVSSKRTFSGRNINASSFQLQRCNFVYVNFRTDGSGRGRGFNLTFNWLISGCGQAEFSELGGFVSSPNYPHQYNPYLSCIYSIRSPGLHSSIFIGLIDLDTEAGLDTVQIWCTTNVTGIFSFSGRSANLSFLELQPCSDVKVRFRTGYRIGLQGRGFKLLFYWTLPTTISSPTTEPTSIQTETDGLHDAPFAILAALGAKMLSLLVVVLASLLCAIVFIIILLSIIFAFRRVKRRNNAMKPRLDVRSVVNPRGCSNDGYSLEPISTCQRPVSVKSDLEEPDYELMDSPNHNDEDVYENVECIVR